MPGVSAEVFGGVVQHGSGGADAARTVLQPEAVEHRHGELAFQQLGGVLIGEDPVVERGPQDGADEHGVSAGLVPLVVERTRQEAFAGLEALEFAFEGFAGVEAFGLEFGGADVEPGEPVDVLVLRHDRAEEVVVAGLQERRVEDGAGRDDAGDGAFDQALRERRVLHLLRHRHFQPGVEQFRDIGVDGAVRHAAHRVSGAVGQHQVEDRGGAQGVLEEHLVEVAGAEEQDGVGGGFRLRLKVLLHHRRDVLLAEVLGGTLFRGSAHVAGCPCRLRTECCPSLRRRPLPWREKERFRGRAG